ncbi:MAG TPA: peptidylprolyl isomerase [Aggregatilineales bacterium]|nr:peptidylprolyl isomerase [Aggregatilineales bacterium]
MLDKVADGAVVSLTYTLKLTNGEVIDFSEDDEPLEYLHGADNIVPGLERQLTGLKVGDKKKVEVEPVDGYGAYDPEDVEVVEREKLPKDLHLKLGMFLAVGDEEGNMSEAYVREVTPKQVTLDFNHPLAGQKLLFDVEVVDIREATTDELAHGHPHGLGHEHDDDDLDFDEDDEEFDFEDDEDDDNLVDFLDLDDEDDKPGNHAH